MPSGGLQKRQLSVVREAEGGARSEAEDEEEAEVAAVAAGVADEHVTLRDKVSVEELDAIAGRPRRHLLDEQQEIASSSSAAAAGEVGRLVLNCAYPHAQSDASVERIVTALRRP